MALVYPELGKNLLIQCTNAHSKTSTLLAPYSFFQRRQIEILPCGCLGPDPFTINRSTFEIIRLQEFFYRACAPIVPGTRWAISLLLYPNLEARVIDRPLRGF